MSGIDVNQGSECGFAPSGRHLRLALVTGLLLCAALTPGSLAGNDLSGQKPSPMVSAGAGPDRMPALQSVGRLLVPAIRYRDGYARHYDEQCSATLVGPAGNAPQSDLILSAWHCVEDYRDLSRSLQFVSAGGKQRRASVIASGGGMHSDWVLLRLAGALPHPVALADADTSTDDGLLMAGYPRDSDPAQAQTVRCRVTGRDRGDRRSDCVLQKGASGGAVLSRDGSRLVGVISRGDGVSQSIFVPLDRFHDRIRAFLPAPGLLHQRN